MLTSDNKIYLGNRIVIIGPSGSGKSFLADLIAKKFNIPICHIDALAHYPKTCWIPRPKEELKNLYNDFVNQNDSWVIDGNYYSLLPERIKKASSIVWLDFNPLLCIFYCLKRYFFDKERKGTPSGIIDRFPWVLIKYLILKYPKKKKKYMELIKENACYNKLLLLNNRKEVNKFCKIMELNIEK